MRDEIGKLVATPEGRDYIVRVPGVSQSALSDARLASVLNWILLEFNAATVPESFEPYSAQEVAASRKRLLADPVRYREERWPAMGNR